MSPASDVVAPAAGPPCPVCSATPTLIGTRPGRLDERRYTYWHCPNCQLRYIGEPRTDFELIYDEDYYKGSGADPLVDYDYELHHSEQTLRIYEWRGLVSIYRELGRRPGRWLDFGCGCGGLVAYARRLGIDIVGFDEGWGAERGREAGNSILTKEELRSAGKFDFITAIEVIEHCADPVAVLRTIRSLLNPGGVLFLTTGNAQPWRGNFMKWGYLSGPEVHVAFFEPGTLDEAFRRAGLETRPGCFFSGYVDIIKYKVMKTLRVRNVHGWIDWLPWGLITRVVDRRHQVTRQPYATAPGG